MIVSTSTASSSSRPRRRRAPIELALCRLCGPEDIITPVTPEDEMLRDGLGPQNWRRHSWWGSPRPIWKRRWFSSAPRTTDTTIIWSRPRWRTISVRRSGRAISSSPSTATLGTGRCCTTISATAAAATTPFAEFLDKDRRARLNNYEIYSSAAPPALTSLAGSRTSEDLARALKAVGIDEKLQLPRAKASHRPPSRVSGVL